MTLFLTLNKPYYKPFRTKQLNRVMTSIRIADNVIFANIGAYKTCVQYRKDDVKEFSTLATNNTRTFESTSREFSKQ
jgi:hypothetical protein